MIELFIIFKSMIVSLILINSVLLILGILVQILVLYGWFK